MGNIYSKVLSMGTDEMLGRVHATVAFLDDCIGIADGNGYVFDEDRIMRNILDGAENDDVYGRICTLIGYVTGEKYKTSNQTLVYEMVTGEKFERTENKPIDAGTSTGSAE